VLAGFAATSAGAAMLGSGAGAGAGGAFAATRAKARNGSANKALDNIHPPIFKLSPP